MHKSAIPSVKWVTIKLPDDLIRKVDAYISTPKSGVRVYDSRSGFIRSVLHAFLTKNGQRVGQKEKKEENIIA